MIAGLAGSILAEGMDELITRSEESCRMCVSKCVWYGNLKIEAA